MRCFTKTRCYGKQIKVYAVMCVILPHFGHMHLWLRYILPRWNFQRSRRFILEFLLFFFKFKTTAWQLLVFPRQLCDWENGGFEWWLSARRIERCHGDTFLPCESFC